jgi:hypothetical protein
MRKQTLVLCVLAWIFPLAAFAQSSSAAPPPPPPDTLLIGTWEGQVLEDGQPYAVVMVVERLQPNRYAGTTTYSGRLNCGGLLTFQRQRAGLFEFRENIDRGSGCADEGRIELWFNQDGSLQFEWYRSQDDPQGIATLERR